MHTPALRGLGDGPPIGRHRAVFVHDLVAAGLSLVAALWLQCGGDPLRPYGGTLARGVPAFVLVAGAAFWTFDLHRGMWRHASLPDLVAVLKAATLAVAAFAPLLPLIARPGGVPGGVPWTLAVIHWLVLVALLGGSRLAYQALCRGGGGPRRLPPARRGPAPIPVLLVGTGAGAALFARAMDRDAEAPYRVVGMLDTGGRDRGRSIHGVPVLGTVGELAAVVGRLDARGLRPRKLVVAEPAGGLRPGALGELLERAGALGLTAARLPHPAELREAARGGRVEPELAALAVEDLLGRPQVELDHAALARLIAGRRVLVTGAGGSIGGELARQVAALRPARLILLDGAECNLYRVDLELGERHPDVARRAVLGDVRDAGRVDAVFAEHRPELVFHAAGLKHVPLVELNPGEGVLTNAVGTRHVADAAAAHGAAAMVLISTDKAVKPGSVMGASKRLAELYCQALDLAGRPGPGGAGARPATRFMVVRFGNVLGSSGSVVPLFRRQLARGGPLTVTHPEVERYFMTVGEAVGLVLQAAARGLDRPDERGRVFVLDMGEPVRIADLARQMVRLAGLRPGADVGIEFVGLRPGEKLREKLFDDEGEARSPAAAGGGILVAAPRRPVAEPEVLRRALDGLAAACRRRDEAALRRLLAGVLAGPGGSGGAAPGPEAPRPGSRAGPAGAEAEVTAGAPSRSEPTGSVVACGGGG